MISKELLSEVLNASIYYMEMQSKNIIVHYDKGMPLMYDDSINIYELAHKCKEWAYKNNYVLIEKCGCVEVQEAHIGVILYISGNSDSPYDIRNTINACQWILNNKDK